MALGVAPPFYLAPFICNYIAVFFPPVFVSGIQLYLHRNVFSQRCLFLESNVFNHYTRIQIQRHTAWYPKKPTGGSDFKKALLRVVNRMTSKGGVTLGCRGSGGGVFLRMQRPRLQHPFEKPTPQQKQTAAALFRIYKVAKFEFQSVADF